MKNSLQTEILDVIEKEFHHLKSLTHLLSPTLIFNLADSDQNNFSKIGGNPTFVVENTNAVKDLKFLGQIDLVKYQKIDESFLFDGIIFFYLKADLDTSPITKKDFSVLFVEKNDLKPSTFVDGYPIVFTESFTLPSYQEDIISDLKFEDSNFEELEEIILDANSTTTNLDYDFAHQILGQPQAIQATVRFWWAINYLGLEVKRGYTEDEHSQIRSVQNDFLLLLQLNLSDPKINHGAFGGSMLYFGIQKEDFEAKKFDRTILVVQNT